ncbi:hypothetical protein A2U01_0045535, partial [Trifolium medium]|nr:hypothetical protein [Trifolium medium]
MYEVVLTKRASSHEAHSDPKPITISSDTDNSTESDKEAEANLQTIIDFAEAHSVAAVVGEVNQQQFHYQWKQTTSDTFAKGSSVL